MIGKVGLVGTGTIARSHAEALAAQGVEVFAYSRSSRHRVEFARQTRATTVGDLESLLAAVEVVDVCTPTDTHHEVVLAAIAAGKRVICEKPLARTTEQAQEMIDAARSAKLWLLPAHVVRFYPAYVAARAAILDGSLGAVERMRFSRVGRHPGARTWFADADRSGGVILDLSIHDLDAARWLAGEVVTVRAELTSDGVAQRSVTMLTHTSGALSQVTAGWDPHTARFDNTLEIIGSKSTFSGNAVKDLSVNPMELQMREFLDVIEGNSPTPRVTAEDGAVALAIALAATESARSGQSVNIPEQES